MRWLVEVSAIGKSELQSFCVEADSWQRALQLVRGHRGETGAMSGFSIELLEAGYRAVDPVARLRFVVKRTSDTAALTPIDSKAAAQAGPSKVMSAPAPAAVTATPAARATSTIAGAHAAVSAASAAKSTLAYSPAASGASAAAKSAPASKPAVAAGSKPDVAPAPGKSSPDMLPRPTAQAPQAPQASSPAAVLAARAVALGLPAALAASTDLDKTVETSRDARDNSLDTTLNTSKNVFDSETVEIPVATTRLPSASTTTSPTPRETAPTVVSPLPVGAPLAGLPPFQVLTKREQDPSAAVPLSYREYVFLVEPGTKEGVAVSILLGQLELVQSSLEQAKTGKLVQLAVFDESYTGKPARPPLATLVWKDWQADPTVHFPRRASLSAPGSKPATGSVRPSKPPAATSAPGASASSAAPAASAVGSPSSRPVKQTLLEPRTTLDDVRAVRPDLPREPDTQVKLDTRDDRETDLTRTAERKPAARTLLGVPKLSEPVSLPEEKPPIAASQEQAFEPLVPQQAPQAPAIQAPQAPVPAPVPAQQAQPVAAQALAPAPVPVQPAPQAPVPAPVADQSPRASAPPPAPEAARRPDFSQTLPMAKGPALPRSTPPPGPVAPMLVPPLAVERAPAFTPPPGHVADSARIAIPIARTGSRLTGDELIASLFEAMHDLHFLHDAIHGADFCLQLAQEVIPSRAGFAHFFDMEKREFLLVRAKGEDTTELVGKRHLEGEPLLAAAVKAKRAILKDGHDAMMNRYIAVGGAKSVVLAPVLVAGRALAVLELVNPNDGAPFTQDEANALTYIAEQYAEFLSSRGLVFDHGRVQSARG